MVLAQDIHSAHMFSMFENAREFEVSQYRPNTYEILALDVTIFF